MYVNSVAFLNRRKIWTKPFNDDEERKRHGFYEKIFKLLKSEDDIQFRKVTRMGFHQFKLMFNILEKRLRKESPRKPIEAECRLVVTLMFLSQGTNFQSLAWMFRMGASTVRKIIMEVCEIIWEELCDIYLSPPSEDEWRKISVDFFNMTGLPHCVGAIDGKHIEMKCPPNSGSLYFNYKKFHSIVLLAACDSNYCFTAVDIGAYGSQSDGGIFSASSFGRKVLHETINLPGSDYLPYSNVKFPYFFVADGAFPLRNNIMRPYPGLSLPEDKSTFNKTLSKARVKIENTFGILTMRWRILLNTINCIPKNVEKIVKAAVILHNFVKMHDGEYCPPSYVDSFDGDERIDGLWRKEAKSLEKYKPFRRFNAPKNAFELRKCLKDYILINK